jgi:hypothetical protein
MAAWNMIQLTRSKYNCRVYTKVLSTLPWSHPPSYPNGSSTPDFDHGAQQSVRRSHLRTVFNGRIEVFELVVSEFGEH